MAHDIPPEAKMARDEAIAMLNCTPREVLEYFLCKRGLRMPQHGMTQKEMDKLLEQVEKGRER